MTTKAVKMQPWQVFHVARRFLGAGRVARIFNKEKRSAYNWAQDPNYTEHRCASPLELLHKLFCEMEARGLTYAIEDAIEYLSTSIETDKYLPEIKEPLPTITEELLADFSIIGDLKEAIDNGASVDDVVAIQKEARAEIDRTVVRYFRDKAKD